MENFKPHIVHKHTENVTWNYFLDTINIEINSSCVQFKDQKSCGNTSVILNGENMSSLDTEIQQGDNLAIITPPNSSLRKKYMEKKLPEDYTSKVDGQTV